jgi:predicted metallopeptidase
MQKALDVEPLYALEFITERFDRLNSEDKIKVIIHELMHIPFTFGGGFKHHDVVNTKNVNKAYELI